MEPHRLSGRGNRRLVGDPIDVVTGANTDVTWDFELPGPIPLRWRRYYKSAQNTVLRPLGWGHSHEFDRTLVKDLDGLSYIGPSGEPIGFPPLEDGEEEARSGYLLRKVEENHYEVEQAGEPTMEFYFAPEQDAAPLPASPGRADDRVSSQVRSPPGIHRLEGTEDPRRERPRGAPPGTVPDRPGDGEPGASPDGLQVRPGRQPGRDPGLLPVHAPLPLRPEPPHDLPDDRRGYSFHFEYDEEGRCVHSRGDDGLLEVFLEYHPELKA